MVTPPHGTIVFVHIRAARPGNYALAISVRSVTDSQKRSVWRGLICKEFVAEEGSYRFFINAPDAPRFKTLVELINEYRTRDLGELAKGTVKGQLSGITLKGSVEARFPFSLFTCPAVAMCHVQCVQPRIREGVVGRAQFELPFFMLTFALVSTPERCPWLNQ